MRILKILGIFSFFLVIVVLTLKANAQNDTLTDYDRAYALIDQRKYSEAIEKYLSFLQKENTVSEPDREKIAEALNNIGICYFMMNNYHEAITWYERALSEDRKIKVPANYATRYNNIGLAYKKLGTYDSAVAYYNKALVLDMQQGDTQSIAKSLNNLGSIYDSWGRYDTAILFYERSLKLKEKLGDSAGMAISLNNIGLVYKEWEKFDQAIQFIEEALAIDRALGKVREIPNRLNNIGVAYSHKKQFDKALEYFQMAHTMANEQNNKDLIATLNANMGSCYFGQQRYDAAIQYLQLAVGIYQELDRPVNLASVYATLADISKVKGAYNQSISYLSQSTKIADQISLKDQLKTNYLLYSDLYAAMGNYSEALNYYKKYVDIKDTLYSEEIHKQITDFEVKYETEKKDRVITLLQQKEVIQTLTIKKDRIFRNSLIGGIALLIMLAVVIYLSLRQKRKANEIIVSEKDKSDKLLLNILPSGIATDLKEKGKTEPQLYENVTVCFTDIVDFTELAARMEPKFLIDELNKIFTAFDTIIEKYNCERIKTIGDAYMAVCGLPDENPRHAENIIWSAVEMIQYLEKKNLESKIDWRIRVGIHSGPVIAGVVGVKKYIYDVFGDTINTASRIENVSEPMRINISDVTYNLVKDKFKFEEREEIEVKGKGKMKMFFIRAESK
ncbi:MAG: tetratricopeptide repeat protein [Bacteroidetes bacterium]|nr:tetratricopeptide repeat protein [Bacteroidota bacterium]